MALGRTKSTAASLVLLLAMAADPPAPASAQMLWNHEEWRYVNYARQGYRPYTGGVWSELRKPAFDELGNYLMQGVQVFRTEEARENDPLAGSLVDESVEYRINLNRLVIGHDSYGDRSSRIMVGDFIRTKFTSLTLDLASLNGVRWDIDLNPTQVTLVSSRMDWPIFPSGRLLARTDRDNEAHRERRWSTYLLGGHVGRRFGALNLGFNYVNLHRTDSLVDWGDNNIRGVLPSAVNRPPAWIAVRVNDGSDEDEEGARVHEMRIRNPELAHVAADVTLHDTEVIDQSYPNGDEFFPLGRRIPPYVQFLKGEFPPAQRRPEGYYQADGTEYLIFWFQIPHELRDTISELEFEALVSDDYDIELSEVFLPISRETSSNPSVSGERATYYYPVAGSRGNVRDQSNLEWIEFSYGRQTGRTTASVRMEYERPGFELTAEMAGTWDFRQHPSTVGRKAWHTTRSRAWFVNFEKHLAGLVVGGELFRMDPLYSTMVSVEDPEYSSYSDDLNSPFGIPHSFPIDRNNTVDMDTVDDNDDKDLAPDFHFLPHLQDGSVLPGRDLDLDGRIDDNQNGNGIPDYLEPFFLYHSDPAEFEYGDDLNNNNIIDHREDDRAPDYPYDVDLEGYHLFIDLEPLRDLRMRLGRFRTDEIWGGGRNDVSYTRVDYERTLFPFGRVLLTNYLKNVRDDIEDDAPFLSVYSPNQLPLQPGTGVGSLLNVQVADELWMRDSLVNTSYLDATLFRFANLNINNRLKYQSNWQRATAFQPANRLAEWSWVLRADYAWHLRGLTVQPRLKYMVYRRSDREERRYPVSERYFYPMLMASYALTDQTTVSAGAQGVPFLEAGFRDLSHPETDWNSRDYIVSLTNRTTYQGQQLSLNMGWHLQVVEFQERARRHEGVDRSLFFLRLILGAEPFKG